MLTEPDLRLIESEADKMKAELHVRVRVRELVAEVRRLAVVEAPKPTVTEAALAVDFLKITATADVPAHAEAQQRAVALLNRFFA